MEDDEARDDHRRAPGFDPGHREALRERHPGQPLELVFDGGLAQIRWPWAVVGIVSTARSESALADSDLAYRSSVASVVTVPATPIAARDSSAGRSERT